jgi:hypothetical protein
MSAESYKIHYLKPQFFAQASLDSYMHRYFAVDKLIIIQGDKL